MNQLYNKYIKSAIISVQFIDPYNPCLNKNKFCKMKKSNDNSIKKLPESAFI